jgi:REP element-mobilizing transposase RayT
MYKNKHGYVHFINEINKQEDISTFGQTLTKYSQTHIMQKENGLFQGGNQTI